MQEYPWLDAADDDGEEDYGPQPPALGNLPKELRKVIRDTKAEAKKYRDEAEQLRAELRKMKVGQTIQSMGLPEKVAKLIPADADPAQWVEEYGDLFGVRGGGESTSPVDSPQGQAPAQAAPAVDPETVQTMQRIAATAETAEPEMISRMQRDLAALNDPNLTEERLLEMIRNGGA